jgi:hypothetical protein
VVADRQVYIYRLVVTLPEGSESWGWEPDNWAAWCKDHGWMAYDREEGVTTFSWGRYTRRKHFMSNGAAERRAKWLREFGATVVVQRSLPVTLWVETVAP